MRKLIIIATLFATAAASASVPNIKGRNISGHDDVRTKDGASCRQAVDGGMSFTAGIYGAKDDSDYSHYDPLRGYQNASNDKGIYAGIDINFGGPKRLDCSRMYNNEMSRKELVLKQEKAKTEIALTKLKEENLRLQRLLSQSNHFSVTK